MPRTHFSAAKSGANFSYFSFCPPRTENLVLDRPRDAQEKNKDNKTSYGGGNAFFPETFFETFSSPFLSRVCSIFSTSFGFIINFYNVCVVFLELTDGKKNLLSFLFASEREYYGGFKKNGGKKVRCLHLTITP